MRPRIPTLLFAVLGGTSGLLACSDELPISGPVTFAVGNRRPAADPSIVVTFGDGGTDRITSDGRGSYQDGACGVKATFNLTDARLDPDASKIRSQDATGCGGRNARKVLVAFTDRVSGSPPAARDGSVVSANFFKVNEVELVTEADGTVLRSAIVVPEGVCAQGLRFNPSLDANTSSLAVSRNADGTWTIATLPFPDDVAVCLDTPQSYYHMPLHVVVRLK